jgi:hypothetical protein
VEDASWARWLYAAAVGWLGVGVGAVRKAYRAVTFNEENGLPPGVLGERKVVGPRSPRWALWSRTAIPCERGLYLLRLRVLETPWFGIMVHDIIEPDTDYDPHDHPWAFVSVVLRGGYTERIWKKPLLRQSKYAAAQESYTTYRRRWLTGSVHRMKRGLAHKIEEVQPNTKTLILHGPRRGSWGFYTSAGFVDWTEYTEGK